MLQTNETMEEGLALSFVDQQARPLGGSLIGKGAREAEFTLPVLMVDGQNKLYRLSVRATGNQLKVSESTSTHLPKSCPNRHINRDSTFCITWASQRPIAIVDAQSADHWWDTVYKFLQEQHRAGKLRRWPSKTDWAHGDAAQEQLRAEEAAATLGGRFLEDLRNGRLSVVKKGHFYRLVTTRGRWLYSVWIQFRRVATLRQYCFCDFGTTKRKVLADCGDHANAAVDLVFGIIGRKLEEERFWKSLKGQPCCGSMDECPLRETTT